MVGKFGFRLYTDACELKRLYCMQIHIPIERGLSSAEPMASKGRGGDVREARTTKSPGTDESAVVWVPKVSTMYQGWRRGKADSACLLLLRPCFFELICSPCE